MTSSDGPSPSNPALSDLWPASALSVRAGDLELRWPDDELITTLAAVAARGVHEPDAMPFSVPWSRGTPRDRALAVLTYQWGIRGDVRPTGPFRLELAVLWRGEPVGFQGCGGEDWAVLRTVETGSWLGLSHQGRGIGTRMRALMLELLFDGLGARAVTSGAWADNRASRAVSERVGYADDGSEEKARDGVATRYQRYRLTRERWDGVRAANLALLGAPVTLDGADRLREFLAS